jgi:uridine phosphorylase
MSQLTETDLILNPDGSVYHLSLLPKHISDTIITVGDPNRVNLVSQFFDEIEFEMNKREFITHVGKFNGKRITVVSTGIGTDNVEIVLNELDALVNVDLKTREPKFKKKRLKIIRIGTSAALQEDIPLGTHLFTDVAVGLDNLMCFYELPMSLHETAIAEEIQQQAKLNFTPYVVTGTGGLVDQICFDMVKGNTVTCPGFYAPQGRKLRAEIRFPNLIEDLNYFHKDDFWLTNFEMETAGYYALARILSHEILSVNAIIANRAANKFSKDPDKIIKSLIQKVLERV